ncbi:MAG TPA: hypothetical protein VE224_07725 [Pseudolabrys sp.]|nr:hypothetical protein [Pseudolabrys sp.]
MKLRSLAVITLLAAVPIGVAAQEGKPPKPTEAQAQKVASAIASDKAKLKIYCDMADLAARIDDADQKKDAKTVEDLSDRMDKMSEQLGPDYVALMDGLQELSPDSKEAQGISKTFDALDDKCGS